MFAVVLILCSATMTMCDSRSVSLSVKTVDIGTSELKCSR